MEGEDFPGPSSLGPTYFPIQPSLRKVSSSPHGEEDFLHHFLSDLIREVAEAS